MPKKKKYVKGGRKNGPSHDKGGIDINVEGGEYIIKKDSVNEEHPDHTSGLTIKGRGFDWYKVEQLMGGEWIVVDQYGTELARERTRIDAIRTQKELEKPVDEGTGGYGKDGKLGKKPAGPHLITKADLKEKIVNMIKKYQ